MPEARGDEPAPEPVPKAAIVAACPAFEGGCPYAKDERLLSWARGVAAADLSLIHI